MLICGENKYLKYKFLKLLRSFALVFAVNDMLVLNGFFLFLAVNSIAYVKQIIVILSAVKHIVYFH